MIGSKTGYNPSSCRPVVLTAHGMTGSRPGRTTSRHPVVLTSLPGYPDHDPIPPQRLRHRLRRRVRRCLGVVPTPEDAVAVAAAVGGRREPDPVAAVAERLG